MTSHPDESHLKPILEAILRQLGLTECPTCHTPLAVGNVGFNTEQDNFEDVMPVVFLACKDKACIKRLKTFYPNDFVHSREEAIAAMAREVTET